MNTKDEDVITTLFVTSTHNPVLFFSSTGRVYRMKVWKLPKAAQRARAADDQPAPAGRGRDHLDRSRTAAGRGGVGQSHLMFATCRGTVRRNSMGAFTNIPTAARLR
jgi:DNA gyrase subunit A